VPKILTLEDLNSVKEKIGFHWKWNPLFLPQKKIVGKSARAYFYLTCSLCTKQFWVEWGSLKMGRSMCCTRCTAKKRVPTIEEMLAIVKKYDMLWQPTNINKIDGKTYRRKYWMKCICGKPEWVRWNHFQQGSTHGCKSCSTRRIKNGLDESDYSKGELKKFWYYINRYIREKQVTKMWNDYGHFRKWALSTGYRKGAKLLRKNSRGNFEEENCYWNFDKAVQKISPNTVRIKGY